MVPDKLSPTFDGNVMLDYRTVHLIECVDGKTDALFNKIVRDSILKVRWELEWFEEVPPEQSGGDLVANGAGGAKGKWVPSVARYYIRIANQLLVEDDESGAEKKGFVMLTADVHVRLIHCSKGKGQEDFNSLVNDGLVQSTDAAREEAQQPIPSSLTDALVAEERASAAAGSKTGSGGAASQGGGGSSSSSSSSRRGGGGGDGGRPSSPSDAAVFLKVLDMAKDLKECMQELLEERDRVVAERTKMARAYNAFTMEGNLDAAFTLAKQMDEIIAADEKSKKNKYSEEPDPQNATAQEAWHLITRIDKTLTKVVGAGGGGSSGTAPSRGGGPGRR
jgi:hypothetical protein